MCIVRVYRLPYRDKCPRWLARQPALIDLYCSGRARPAIQRGRTWGCQYNGCAKAYRCISTGIQRQVIGQFNDLCKCRCGATILILYGYGISAVIQAENIRRLVIDSINTIGVAGTRCTAVGWYFYASELSTGCIGGNSCCIQCCWFRDINGGVFDTTLVIPDADKIWSGGRLLNIPVGWYVVPPSMEYSKIPLPPEGEMLILPGRCSVTEDISHGISRHNTGRVLRDGHCNVKVQVVDPISLTSTVWFQPGHWKYWKSARWRRYQLNIQTDRRHLMV